MNIHIKNILDFWFGDIRGGITVDDRNEFWFMPNPHVDRVIKDKFENLVIKAGRGDLKDWENTPKGSLALIILIDQFTRNIYRGTKEAFKYDTQAQRLCNHGIEKGFDGELEVIEKCFYYLPLEHSENLADQNKCVKLYEDLLLKVDANQVNTVNHSLNYALIHRDIIEKFGRFPHRNKILNRDSSKKELEYLLKNENNFGQ